MLGLVCCVCCVFADCMQRAATATSCYCYCNCYRCWYCYCCHCAYYTVDQMLRVSRWVGPWQGEPWVKCLRRDDDIILSIKNDDDDDDES